MLQGRDGTRFLISATRRLIRYGHGLRGTAVVSFYANYEWFSSEKMSYGEFHQQSVPFGQPVPLSANITENFPVHLHLPVGARVRRWETIGRPSHSSSGTGNLVWQQTVNCGANVRLKVPFPCNSNSPFYRLGQNKHEFRMSTNPPCYCVKTSYNMSAAS